MKVLIIGAGPAGLEAARILEENNIVPTIIEKKPLPQDKPCAGGLTGIKVNDNVITHNLIVHKDDAFDVINPICMITRKELSDIQLNKLQKTRILKETVVNIDKGRVRTNKNTHPFDLLIGADGANSIVRRHLKLKSKFTLAFYQEVNETLNASQWHIQPEFGYIWKFPKRSNCNVGIYFHPKYLSGKEAVSILKKTTGSDSRIRGGLIQYRYHGYRFKNIFLAGEAAGFTSRITGEGIYPAIVSGREVAAKIIDPGAKTPEINRLIINKYLQQLLFCAIRYFPSATLKALKRNRQNAKVIGII